MNFYESLPLFQDFRLITGNEHFRAVPADWVLVMTDVKDSRRAIARGRYKDVNLMGAATIVVARKVVVGEGFPFVFGGDGATLLVPRQYLAELLEKLCGLQQICEQHFGLELRVGHVTVEQLYREGADLEAAKYELTKGECLAMLRGSALALAEHKIKNDERYRSCYRSHADVDLGGLSCRWKAIPSVRGKIVSLLVQADSLEIYRQVLSHLNNIFPEGVEAHNPVDTEIMSYKSVFACLREEFNLHQSMFTWKFLRRCLIIVSMVLIYRYRLPLKHFKAYKTALRRHSDYRKFDGVLRMTLDCTGAQISLMRFYLDTLANEHKIKYGICENDSALITCYVEGLKQGEHLHFVDGADGGYAVAAENMKSF